MGTHAIGARELRLVRGISLFDINNERDSAERRSARARALLYLPSSSVDSNRYNDLARYRLKDSSSSMRDEERGGYVSVRKSRYLIAETPVSR